MGLGDLVNTHPKATLAGVVLLLVGSATAIMLRSGVNRSAVPSQSYYYDLREGKLFAAPAGTPTGASAALAHVYSCGDCADTSTHFTGYIERHTEEALAALKSGSADAEKAYNAGHLVAAASTEPRWIQADSGEGTALQGAPLLRCPQAHECRPQ